MGDFFRKPNGEAQVNPDATLRAADLQRVAAASVGPVENTFVRGLVISGLSLVVDATGEGGSSEEPADARELVLWALEVSGLVATIGQTLAETYGVTDPNPAWVEGYLCTSVQVVWTGPGMVQVQETYTRRHLRDTYSGQLVERPTSIHYEGAGRTPTTVSVTFSKPRGMDNGTVAGLIPVRVPRLVIMRTRTYLDADSLLDDIADYFGMVNDATFGGFYARQWLVTDLQTEVLGDSERCFATWVMEWCGREETHDPISVYRQANGVIPSGVLPLRAWDASAPVHYDASSDYWRVDGCKRLEYYDTANLSAL
jgi:hypothetical protein